MFRVFTRGLIVIVGGLAVLVAVAVLRLMAGPIELEFLREHAQREFSTSGGKVKIAADRVLVEGSSIGRPMLLVLHDVRAVDESGRVLASAPTIAVSFEPRSVLEGVFAPVSVTIVKPVLDADLRKGGLLRSLLNRDETEPQSQVAGLLIDQLLGDRGGNHVLGQLDTVLVEQATVVLRDSKTGLSWTAANGKARLKRDATGVVVSAEARFEGASEPIDVAVSGIYSRDRSHVSFDSRIDNVRLPQFADFGADLASCTASMCRSPAVCASRPVATVRLKVPSARSPPAPGVWRCRAFCRSSTASSR